MAIALTGAATVSLLLSGCITIHTEPPRVNGSYAATPYAGPPTPTAAPTPTAPTFPTLNGCPSGFRQDFLTATDVGKGPGYRHFSDDMTEDDFFYGVGVPATGCFVTMNGEGQSEDGNPNWIGVVPGDYSVVQSFTAALVSGGFTNLVENPGAKCSAVTSPNGRQIFDFYVNDSVPTNQPGNVSDVFGRYFSQYPYISIHAVPLGLVEAYASFEPFAADCTAP